MKITAKSNPAQPTAVFGQFLRCRSNNFGLPLASYTEPRLGSHMRGPGQSMHHQVVDFLKKEEAKQSQSRFVTTWEICLPFCHQSDIIGQLFAGANLEASVHHLFSPSSSNQSHNLCHFFSLPCQLFHSGVTEHTEQPRTTISRETQRSVPRALIDCRRRASGDERTPVSRRFLAGEITGFCDGHCFPHHHHWQQEVID